MLILGQGEPAGCGTLHLQANRFKAFMCTDIKHKYLANECITFNSGRKIVSAEQEML